MFKYDDNCHVGPSKYHMQRCPKSERIMNKHTIYKDIKMRKAILTFCILLSMILITEVKGSSQFKSDAIDAVKLTSNDIPEGFMYGTVPGPYRKTLKENPWMMDKAAIKRLADLVYPGGDYSKIAGMHVSIITNKKTPLGDDIVCYVILFNSMKSAQAEIKKATEFAGYNRDRVLLLTKDNLAILLFVDDIENFHFIQDLAKKIGERLQNI
jgi:hypothetical protein